MVTVILDTNALQQEWLCTGLRFELLRHSRFYPPLSVCVPAVVFEELVANHGREVQKTMQARAAADRKLRRLGVAANADAVGAFDYRGYLRERFDDVLSITVLDWPAVDHAALVTRAVTRRPPFNDSGGGYRDALVWADVLSSATAGSEVYLVTQDRAFGTDGSLHPSLAAEVEKLPGSVQLVDDFGAWLLTRLPWATGALADAVDKSRDEEFTEWFMASDFQENLMPAVEDISFPALAYRFDVFDIEWDGNLERVRQRNTEEGVTVVEYDIGQTVTFQVELPTGVEIEAEWELQPTLVPGRIVAKGAVSMYVQVAVLFDAEHWGVEELAWRRADGRRAGPGLIRPDPMQQEAF